MRSDTPKLVGLCCAQLAAALAVVLAGCGGGGGGGGGQGFGVTGRVLDQVPQPVQGAVVTIGSRPSVATDPNGRFTVVGLTEGTQPIRVEKNGFVTHQDTVLAPSADVQVFLVPLQDPRPGPPPPNITGNVSLSGPNASITIQAFLLSDPVNPVDQVTLAGPGSYGLLVPAPGTYNVVAGAVGYQSQTQPAPLATADATAAVSFALSP